MTLFRRKNNTKPRSPGEKRFATAYWLVKDLTSAQYSNLKTYMDEIYDAANGMNKIKTKDEKINEADSFLETEVNVK